eukprot:1142476-Pelagomonas_calceolata.AAC.2
MKLPAPGVLLGRQLYSPKSGWGAATRISLGTINCMLGFVLQSLNGNFKAELGSALTTTGT